MAEAVAADGAGVGFREFLLLGEHVVFDEAGVVVVVRFLVQLGFGDRSVAAPFPLPFSSAERCVAAMSSVSIPASAST